VSARVLGARVGLAILAVVLLWAAVPAASQEGRADLPTIPLTCGGDVVTITGTDASEVITGTAGADVISGLGGNDTIHGLGGNDIICGGYGRDVVHGEAGADRVFGGPGGDKLYGGTGADALDGGVGNDVCKTGETFTSCERPAVSRLAAGCPSAAEVARINADLAISFESDPTAGTLACLASQGSANLTPLQKRAYNAVRIMQHIPFDAPLPWTSLGLYDWFVSAVDGIRFRGDIGYSYCCEPAGVINLKTGLAGEQTDLWINPDWNVGLAHLMILMVHEARHNQGYPHTCDGGTSDDTLAQMGAWGVQYYLQLWLAQHASPVFMKAPLAGNPGYYQWRHGGDAQGTLSSSFCNE